MRKKILLLFAIVIAGAFVYSILLYYKITKNVIWDQANGTHLYIERISTSSQLFTQLSEEPFNLNRNHIELVASIINLNDLTLKQGRYLIPNEFSTWSLLRYLKSGKQDPVNVVIHNEPTIELIAGKLSRYLESDSLEILMTLQDEEEYSKYNLDQHTLISLFIPNTYQVYWNTTPEGFLKRMKTEHDKFWGNDRRLEKAQMLNMTTVEVYTLASIVEKESKAKLERPIIAGLYLNRLKIGMRLQADPTVVFAIGDFSINRVLNKHLEFDSPYNTYLYEGLPPGPIGMASINSLDAVLNAEDHQYIYMCAAADNSGTHVFAKTFGEHQVNAYKYRTWLNSRGIIR